MRSGFIAPALMAVFPSALMQEIADYSFLFPLVALRYFEHSGDRDFLITCADCASRIIDTYRKYEGEDGLLSNVTGQRTSGTTTISNRTIPCSQGCIT